MIKTPITVAHGDGIGPEIMGATLKILEAAGAALEIETINIGEQVYLQGISSGIQPAAWDSLCRTKVFLKAPITTPQGKGVKSLNVTVRKTLGLYANARPCKAYAPFVQTRHPNMDVVIIRENEEGLYGAIEHRQTPEVYQCLRLISIPGTERIARYAFEYARQNKRKRVTCFTKDNIMKMTDGAFHKIFNEVAKEYPDIESDHKIIDIGTARLADVPEQFDVILAPNLYGDIISDVAAEIAGSVGLVGTSNVGEQCTMFEAIHGSAPDIAGKNIANPSGLLLGAVMMLVHIGQTAVAEKVHNAWLKTIEDGCHTADIYDKSVSTEKCTTERFTQAVIERLGQTPQKLRAAQYESGKMKPIQCKLKPEGGRQLVGVDVFVCADLKVEEVDGLAEQLIASANDHLALSMITNRGTKVWPEGMLETFCVDHWRCRFKAKKGTLSPKTIVELLDRLVDAGVDVIKTENLYQFGNEAGFSKAQGE